MRHDATRYKILALAPVDPNPARSYSEAPFSVARATLDECMAAMNIHFWLPLDAHLSPAGGIELAVDRLKALHPDGIVQGNAYLNQLIQAGAFLNQARLEGQSAARIAEELHRWPDLPAVPLSLESEHATSPGQASSDAVDEILKMVAMPIAARPATSAPNPFLNLAAEILHLLLHDPGFRRMEAAWRGLHLLLTQGAVNEAVSVQLAPLHPETFLEGLNHLASQVQIDPPALIMIDHSFNNTAPSIERMRELARWAEALMVPVVAWVAPDFLQIDSWEKITRLPYLPHHLDNSAYAPFRALRQAPESRWLSLTCNRLLVRYPYGPENRARRTSVQEREPLWIAPVWGLAALIAQSVCHTGWPTRFTERTRFQLQDLALANTALTPPLVVEFNPDTERRSQLLKSGLSPLGTESGRDRAFCSEAVTLAGSSLKHQLLICQVTQFLLWCQENLPTDRTPSDLEFQLKLAFQVFSERSHPPGLSRILIKAGNPDDKGRLPVRVAVTPQNTLLAGETPIELHLDW